jgi:heme/copper-type cytochrome/quinol oxidase subunit 2
MQTTYIIFLLAFIICLFFVWFFSHRANHKERLMMIEKGMDMEEQVKKKARSGFPWLKLGILVIG